MPTHLAPIRREVRVPAPQATAFDWFTLRVAEWWPRVGLAIGGSLTFIDGQLEEHTDDDVYVWAEVITWDRPRGLQMAWREPRHSADQRTHVELRFVPDQARTIVRLIHSGWERVPDPAESVKRAGGDRGWREVLGAYEAAVSRP
jgi:hypothetical protein